MSFVIHGGVIKNCQGQIQVLSKGDPEKHHWICKKSPQCRKPFIPPPAHSLIHKASPGEPATTRIDVQETCVESRAKTKEQAFLAPHHEAGVWVSAGLARDRGSDAAMTHELSAQNSLHEYKGKEWQWSLQWGEKRECDEFIVGSELCSFRSPLSSTLLWSSCGRQQGVRTPAVAIGLEC